MHPAIALVLSQAAAETTAITGGVSGIVAEFAAVGRRMGAEATDFRRWLEANPEALLIGLLVAILLLAVRALTPR